MSLAFIPEDFLTSEFFNIISRSSKLAVHTKLCPYLSNKPAFLNLLKYSNLVLVPFLVVPLCKNSSTLPKDPRSTPLFKADDNIFLLNLVLKPFVLIELPKYLLIDLASNDANSGLFFNSLIISLLNFVKFIILSAVNLTFFLAAFEII